MWRTRWGLTVLLATYTTPSMGRGAEHSAPLKVKYQRLQPLLAYTLSVPVQYTWRAVSEKFLMNTHSYTKKRNRYASKNVPVNSLVCIETRKMKTGHDLFTLLSFFYIFCPLVFLWFWMLLFHYHFIFHNCIARCCFIVEITYTQMIFLN